MFSFNFLQKAKDHGNARREKANPNKEKRGNKEKNLENESRLIENYLSNPQRSKKVWTDSAAAVLPEPTTKTGKGHANPKDPRVPFVSKCI